MIKQKVAFITGIYKAQEIPYLNHLKKEIRKLDLPNYKIYLFDNRKDNKGYAYGINKGIKKAIEQDCEIFIILNPDISFLKLNQKVIENGLKKFDVLGFAMKQEDTTYYGGKIDRYRLSGGLITQKPNKQYQPVDFISGALMILSRKVIEKVGLLNESYFIYYEDVEYCLSAKNKGFRVGIDSRNYYKHFEISKSNNPNKKRLLFVNRLKFFNKFSTKTQKLREIIRAPLTIYEHLPLFWTLIKQGSFTLNFFSLNVSSILGKATHFFIFIVLIRTLNPAQYGIYTLVWAFVNLFTPFLDFGTTTYGLVYGSDKQKTTRILFSLRLFLSIVVYLLVIASSFFFFSDPVTKLFIGLTATSLLSSSISGSYLIHNSLKQKVFISSYLSLAFNIIFALFVISALLLKQGISYLFISYAITYLGYFLLNLFLLNKQIDYRIYIKKWLVIFKQSLTFVFIGFLAGFYFKADIFILSKFYNNQTLGVYSAGMKFLDAFLIIPGSYNIIVIPIMRQLASDKQKLLIKIKKDVVFLFFIGVAVVGVFYLAAPILLNTLLREKFASSLGISKVLILSILPILITSVFYNALYGLKKERYVLFILFVQSLVSILVYWLTITKYSFYGAMYTKVGLEVFNTFLTLSVLKFACAENE